MVKKDVFTEVEFESFIDRFYDYLDGKFDLNINDSIVTSIEKINRLTELQEFVDSRDFLDFLYNKSVTIPIIRDSLRSEMRNPDLFL